MQKHLSKALPEASWFEYSPLSRDNERAGTTLALGKPHRANLNLKNADLIAAFDSDFLLTHPASLKYTRDFARNRTADDRKSMSRLYVIESNLSLTGSNADDRYAERCGDVAIRLCQLGAELMKQGLPLPASATSAKAALEKFDAAAQQPKYLEEIARDLVAYKGRSVITVGPRQPAEAHAVAALLNAALENAGKTVNYFEEPDGPRPTHIESIASLVDRLNGGSVKSLVILGGNPAYDAPADVNFKAALEKFKDSSIHLSLYRDETSRLCQWHVPMAHELEAWGDARAWDGTVSIQQPLIDPLYGGKSPIELLAMLLGEETLKGYDLVRRTFQTKFTAAGDLEASWREALHDGIVAKTGWDAKTPAISLTDWSKPLADLTSRWAPGPDKRTGASTYEVVFTQDLKVYDGRYVNNAWLQELPDPITKMTWDNAALISVADAHRLGIKRDAKVEITLGGSKLTIPVCEVPGHAPGSITLPLGYGRDVAGRVAEGAGFNVNVLRTKAAYHFASGATMRVLGDSYMLATTQDHHAMDTDVGNQETARRVPELARAGTLAEYASDKSFVKKRAHSIPLVQMFGSHDQTFEKAYRWAMGIDLSKCTGCSACVVACQAENNVPVVGKHEVHLGREMHWMRIDRYFVGSPDAPAVIHQPVACQHCENAPCEQVCPVAATVHDEQGLNVMVYNRCIGTRYCSNNCPYKVRRFNWFYNHHGPRHPRSRQGGETVFQTFNIKDTPNMLPETTLTDIEKMAFNPDVTVRSRGVMEKCTFCVQRIAHAKIVARNDHVSPKMGPAGSGEIPDVSVDREHAVVPACAQVCPAEAIVFGDLNWNSYWDEREKKLVFRDERRSDVYKWHEHHRSYVLLEELNVRPRNKYLAKLRNPAHDEGGSGEKHGAEQA